MLSLQIFVQILALKSRLGDLAVILVYRRRVKLSKAAIIFPRRRADEHAFGVGAFRRCFLHSVSVEWHKISLPGFVRFDEGSVCGRRASGAEGGEKCLANRSRSATSRRRATDGSPPLMAAHCGCPLVTSARFAEWNGRRREGTGTTGSPWNAANRALVTASRQVMSGMTRIRW
jgi:hypothetical protein